MATATATATKSDGNGDENSEGDCRWRRRRRRRQGDGDSDGDTNNNQTTIRNGCDGDGDGNGVENSEGDSGWWRRRRRRQRRERGGGGDTAIAAMATAMAVMVAGSFMRFEVRKANRQIKYLFRCTCTEYYIRLIWMGGAPPPSEHLWLFRREQSKIPPRKNPTGST